MGALMDIFSFSFNAIFPLILVVSLGYFLKHINLLEEEFILKANQFCFMVAFPLQLFYNIYHLNLSLSLDASFIFFIVASIIIMVLGLFWLVPILVKDTTKYGAFIQGAYRSNFLLIGLPLASNLFGETGVQTASIALPIVVPIYNFIAVIILSLFANHRHSETGDKIRILSLMGTILKNPLIIASFLGLLMSLIRFPIPLFLDRAVHDVGTIATPFALILLGAQFSFQALHGRIKLAIVASLLRVLILPAIIISVAILLGFRGIELGIVMIIFSTPSAISGYIMSKNMDNDAELSGQIIVLTTLLSSLTLFAWVFSLRWFGLI